MLPHELLLDEAGLLDQPAQLVEVEPGIFRRIRVHRVEEVFDEQDDVAVAEDGAASVGVDPAAAARAAAGKYKAI